MAGSLNAAILLSSPDGTFIETTPDHATEYNSAKNADVSVPAANGITRDPVGSGTFAA